MVNIKQYVIALSADKHSLKITFQKTSLCDAVGMLELGSRLLHTLKPNKNGIWVVTKQPRVNAYLLGFPRNFIWERPEKNVLFIKSPTSKISEGMINELDEAITGIQGDKEADSLAGSVYHFKIKDLNTNKIYEYTFTGRGRAIIAFCVLWDLQDHPRNDLEFISKEPILNEFPVIIKESASRYYGDPSKAADELRNQGFPRKSDVTNQTDDFSLNVYNTETYGNLQTHYQLLKREQNFEYKVGRSTIPKSIKQKLYEHYNFTCNVCKEKFPFEYLAPDHRVPSIVQEDNLTVENYITVLQCLCKGCNQVKRESCKKCPYNKDCTKCHWAYPEKHMISKVHIQNIKALSEAYNLTPDELLKKLLEKIKEIN